MEKKLTETKKSGKDFIFNSLKAKSLKRRQKVVLISLLWMSKRENRMHTRCHGSHDDQQHCKVFRKLDESRLCKLNVKSWIARRISFFLLLLEIGLTAIKVMTQLRARSCLRKFVKFCDALSSMGNLKLRLKDLKVSKFPNFYFKFKFCKNR